jgi:hypothetical protein
MDLFSLDIQIVLSKKEIHGSLATKKNRNGGEKMEETEEKKIVRTIIEKEEIDWAKYLDHTRFLQPGEINNYSQEQFKNDFEENE